MTDRPWDDAAACRDADPEMWFSHWPADILTAKQVCSTCEVRAECLAYALEHRLDDGIWGGRDEDQLRSLRRAASRRAA